MNPRYFSSVVTVILLLSGCCFSQVRNYRSEALLMKKTIQQYHVSPRAVDDAFSKLTYDNFLDELDPNRLFFSESDLKAVGSFSLKLDDELNGTSWTFLSQLTLVYKKCLQRAEVLSEQVFQTALGFSVTESYARDTTWARNEDELKDRWRLAIKYEVMERLQEMYRADPAKDDTKFILRNETEARKRARAGVRRSIQRSLNHPTGFENYVGSLFLQSIANAFDPHSMYLSPTAMENFLASLSSEGYYFGLLLDENLKGDIVIEQLTPGGPAWKSGMLNSGDVIRQVQWEGQEPLDLYGFGLDEFNDMLLETNHSSMELSVIKPGGLSVTVVLRKEKMAAEENIVKSFVLQGKRKIGYISLPGFYSNWGEKEGMRCANDVAKEIVKLKKENIEGLILDLRFNGGGSLEEAVAMTGIFIDAGPVGIVKNKMSEMETIKDMNRGTIYDGPLVLMVNGMSASASEFLAAALQDYQRAIVVGSRTFGKATGQSLFPLDIRSSSSSPATEIKPGIGYATITMEKIYRITGKTAQQRGVIPQIELPDVYDHLEFREHTMPLALPFDSVFKKTYYQPLLLLPVRELRHRSEQRLKAHAGFSTIRRASELLSAVQHDKKPVSLKWGDTTQETTSLLVALGEMAKSAIDSTIFKVDHHNFEKQRMHMDEFIQDFNKVWIKKLKRDITLEETFHIICDYIEINLRKK